MPLTTSFHTTLAGVPKVVWALSAAHKQGKLVVSAGRLRLHLYLLFGMLQRGVRVLGFRGYRV